LFKHGRISKTYWAVVEGGPTEDEGVIDMPLGRLNAERGWWQKPDPEGQTAVTRWKVLGRSFVAAPVVGDVYSPPPCGVETSEARSQGSGVGVPQGQTAVVDPPPQPSPARGEGAVGSSGSTHFTWLALELVTGRTHQLRVHAASMGWPIVGDNIYGNGPRFGEPSLHLHSREIVIPISRNKEPVRAVAPAPAHLQQRLRACGWNGE